MKNIQITKTNSVAKILVVARIYKGKKANWLFTWKLKYIFVLGRK